MLSAMMKIAFDIYVNLAAKIQQVDEGGLTLQPATSQSRSHSHSHSHICGKPGYPDWTLLCLH